MPPRWPALTPRQLPPPRPSFHVGPAPALFIRSPADARGPLVIFLLRTTHVATDSGSFPSRPRRPPRCSTWPARQRCPSGLYKQLSPHPRDPHRTLASCLKLPSVAATSPSSMTPPGDPQGGEEAARGVFVRYRGLLRTDTLAGATASPPCHLTEPCATAAA